MYIITNLKTFATLVGLIGIAVNIPTLGRESNMIHTHSGIR